MTEGFFFQVEHLAQRRNMCFDCPSRQLRGKKPDTAIRDLAVKPHRCHHNLNQGCAGNLGGTEEGVSELMWQASFPMEATN